MTEEQYAAGKERLDVLKARLEARSGKDEFNENRRAIQASIDEMEPAVKAYEDAGNE